MGDSQENTDISRLPSADSSFQTFKVHVPEQDVEGALPPSQAFPYWPRNILSRRCTPGQVGHVLDSLVQPRGLGMAGVYGEVAVFAKWTYEKKGRGRRE